MKVAILYGSSTGKTEAVADQLQRLFPDSDVFGVADTEATQLEPYELLLIGTSTWGTGDLQDDWKDRLDAFPLHLAEGKTLAFFGLGDRKAFPETFCAAVELLRQRFAPAANRVLDPPLLLDDDNEPSQTEARVGAWALRLQAEDRADR